MRNNVPKVLTMSTDACSTNTSDMTNNYHANMNNVHNIVNKKRHTKYFQRCLDVLPPRLASHDSTRVTLAFFAICGLDVLNSLDVLSENRRREICDWIYRFQIISNDSPNCSGFQGSSTLNIKDADASTCGSEKYKWGHLAMSYTGISMLVTLGDDLSRLNRKAIVDGVAAVQRTDGSFSASIEGNEHDMRFVYCAAAICYMLDDWGSVNKQLMANYIKNSIRYDSGISQHYEMESHGGTTFCAIAALHLSGQMDVLSESTRDKLIRWLVFRQQESGFNGRPNKPSDACYSFWIGATLKILGAFQFTNFSSNREYLLETQDVITGGFSKWPGSSPDPFHTYFSLCGLSFIKEEGLEAVMPSLNISQRAYDRLCDIQRTWKQQRTNDATDTRLDIE
ncbi:geranylgeranyl transferase type-1 subunit beta isoform X1 [Sitodiplosis mosellana]|uniref:geranylgeranyl transferase type-1 subunit beta isoform X1 n=1 Tax=Sitodiplosis mosellana TaxID=263140 RepID=UPI0024443A6F|nr:geranylgeranyl transferase type-1 subunit beta isoform X1 [Sitodiplosis mosellana]